ncbi:nucleoside deaminase [Haloferax sp. MBLA0078]|uniref:Nucleoside deaminase n=2 Tax=Haloferacaceae TaxID=1644056 RepID=A0A6A8GCL7_9EURY|nr:nucleoside deaminase [Haloferax sp. CBA1150]MRW98278.1 nucleoside deaminase [Haloferax marinum]
MRVAFELAREAAARGDEPFGSVLVLDDTIVMSESNRIETETDIRYHPELHLAYRACREYDSKTRAEMVMYTSTEPCPMCSGGMLTAGFNSVVYSVSSDEIARITGRELSVNSTDVLGGVTDVVGPLLNDEGRQVHEEYGWA